MERYILIVKFVKIDLQNHIGYEIMNDCVICSVEQESLDAIPNDFCHSLLSEY